MSSIQQFSLDDTKALMGNLSIGFHFKHSRITKPIHSFFLFFVLFLFLFLLRQVCFVFFSACSLGSPGTYSLDKAGL